MIGFLRRHKREIAYFLLGVLAGLAFLILLLLAEKLCQPDAPHGTGDTCLRERG